MVELLSVLAMLIGGSALLRTVGIRGWALPFLGFLAGACLLVTIGLLQIAAHAPTTPVLTLALTAVVPVAGWAVRHHLTRDVPVPVFPAFLAVLAVVVIVAVLRELTLVSWSNDSYRYLMTGSAIADGTYHDLASPKLLTKRLIGTPLLHAPAHLAGEHFLRSVTPLLAVSTVAATAWLLQQGLRAGRSRVWTVALAGLGVLLLLTNNRFVFHSFYLNGHLFVAALLLVIAGSGWLLATRAGRIPVPALFTLQAVAVPALVVTRAEASMVAVVALLPMLLSERVPLRLRSAVLAILGGSVTLWQSFMLVTFRAQQVEPTPPVAGLLALGVLLLLLIPLLRWRPLLAHQGRALLATELGLWLALAAFAAARPQVLVDSVHATVQNVVVGAGAWGASLVVLAALVVGVLVYSAAPELVYLRFPVTAFLPLSFLLAYLRDAAYRVGDGDSLNRMLLHIVPLAVVYVIAAGANGDWRFRAPEPAEPAPAVTGA